MCISPTLGDLTRNMEFFLPRSQLVYVRTHDLINLFWMGNHLHLDPKLLILYLTYSPKHRQYIQTKYTHIQLRYRQIIKFPSYLFSYIL